MKGGGLLSPPPDSSKLCFNLLCHTILTYYPILYYTILYYIILYYTILHVCTLEFISYLELSGAISSYLELSEAIWKVGPAELRSHHARGWWIGCLLSGSALKALPSGILSQALVPDPGNDVLLPIFITSLVWGLALGSCHFDNSPNRACSMDFLRIKGWWSTPGRARASAPLKNWFSQTFHIHRRFWPPYHCSGNVPRPRSLQPQQHCWAQCL